MGKGLGSIIESRMCVEFWENNMGHKKECEKICVVQKNVVTLRRKVE